MVFNSFGFIFIFLPLCLMGYYVLNQKKKYQMADLFLLFFSLFFYALNDICNIFVIGASVIINYTIIVLMNWRKKKVFLIAGILLNCGILICFKYMNFVISNTNQLFEMEIESIQIFSVLGISYLTFQQIAFLVDNYRKEVPKYRFIEYCLFCVYFPKAIAGPIIFHSQFFPQLQCELRRKFDYEAFSKGLYSFSLGMGKKVLIADLFGQIVDCYYGNLSQMNTLSTGFAVLGYTLQLYFDFSGYCDMANGISMMFRIELPINFNSPYKSISISEFWDRWHISLTQFFTKYIYIPLGGSRRGIIRTYVNIMCIYLISGIWHGVGWTFIIWGGIHGGLTIVERLFKKQIQKWNQVLRWFLTFGCVNFAWIFFRAENIAQVKGVIRNLLEFDYAHISEDILNVFKGNMLGIFLEISGYSLELKQCIYTIEIIVFYLITMVLCLRGRNVQEQVKGFVPTKRKVVLTVCVMVLSILSFSKSVNFIYSGF